MSVNLEEKLFSIRYKVEHQAHLKIRDQALCQQCEGRACTTFCPAQVYTVEADGQIHVAFENCIECGTCRIGCGERNIAWLYPTGGYGIAYKFG